MGARKPAAEAAEQRALRADLAAQEHGPAQVRTPRLAAGYVNAVHPETGQTVTFVPGETLPDWVADE